MKMCHSAAMKKIKQLETKKENLINNEDRNCRISYKEGEKKITTSYDYAKTREEINNIDSQVRLIRHRLAQANCTVLLPDENITIGEALVYLAQLKNKESQLEFLSNNKQIARDITSNGVLEYTECLYDITQVEKDLEIVQDKISSLQLAIDNANMTNYIDIE